MRWFRFFFGTPHRALGSLLAVLAVALVEHFAPGATAKGLITVFASAITVVITLCERFLGPLAWAVMPLIIAGIGFRLMIRGFRR